VADVREVSHMSESDCSNINISLSSLGAFESRLFSIEQRLGNTEVNINRVQKELETLEFLSTPRVTENDYRVSLVVVIPTGNSEVGLDQLIFVETRQEALAKQKEWQSQRSDYKRKIIIATAEIEFINFGNFKQI
jgi:hypothetical protein